LNSALLGVAQAAIVGGTRGEDRNRLWALILRRGLNLGCELLCGDRRRLGSTVAVDAVISELVSVGRFPC
jgi:hypothetical protein